MIPTAEVATGRLQGLSYRAGRSQAAVRAFHGIPYATDPVGPMRFRAPQPPEAWAGVRDASTFAPSSMQSPTSLFSGTIPGNHVATTSERCLTGVPEFVGIFGGGS